MAALPPSAFGILTVCLQGFFRTSVVSGSVVQVLDRIALGGQETSDTIIKLDPLVHLTNGRLTAERKLIRTCFSEC